MAALTITASSVQVSGGTKTAVGTAGATITAGQVLYKDTADSNKLKLADADSTAPLAVVAGIALHGAASGQPIQYLTESGTGTFTLGSVLTSGLNYFLSGTAGGISPEGDLTTNWRSAYLGVAEDVQTLKVKINNGTAARA